MTFARLKSVAGVRNPDTALCIAAVDLLDTNTPSNPTMYVGGV
jgi:hypothetical protein